MSSHTSGLTSIDDVRAFLRHLMDERCIPGMQISVLREGELAYSDNFGLANVEHQIPVTSESVFSINSITKAFTGVAVMQLVEAGLVDLDASIATYVEGLPEAWRSIPVRDFAYLRSGVPEIMATRPDRSISLIGGGDEDAAWAEAYRAPMEFSPGERFSYSQTNFALLGKVIEGITHKPFETVIAEQLEAAGMRHTLYANDGDIIPGRATTYLGLTDDGSRAETISISRIDWPPVLRTVAGLHSTAEDMVRWIHAVQTGRLVRESTLGPMFERPPYKDGRAGVWGVGWLSGETHVGRVPAPGGGCKSQIALYPDGLGIVLLTNLIGGIPEQLEAVHGEPVDLGFLDPVAQYFSGRATTSRSDRDDS